jgi:hypothetical protein
VIISDRGKSVKFIRTNRRSFIQKRLSLCYHDLDTKSLAIPHQKDEQIDKLTPLSDILTLSRQFRSHSDGKCLQAKAPCEKCRMKGDLFPPRVSFILVRIECGISSS